MKQFAIDLLGAFSVLGDWFALSVTALVVATFVLLGICTGYIEVSDAILRYSQAMAVAVAVVLFSSTAAKLHSRFL